MRKYPQRFTFLVPNLFHSLLVQLHIAYQLYSKDSISNYIHSSVYILVKGSMQTRHCNLFLSYCVRFSCIHYVMKNRSPDIKWLQSTSSVCYKEIVCLFLFSKIKFNLSNIAAKFLFPECMNLVSRSPNLAL